jgi:hypothetical protein
MRVAKHTLSQEVFLGWPAVVLRQEGMALSVVPSVGGRLMGIHAGAHALCFVHPELQGKNFCGDATQWDVLCGDWSFPLWGGGKTWVAPESAWPQGAPHRDLDSLAWQVTKSWCNATSMGIAVQSPACSDSGLQITRHLRWPIGAREWTVAHTLRNAGVQTQRCGVWDVLMLKRPATVKLPLPKAISGVFSGVVALPGKPAVETLLANGILELDEHYAWLRCTDALEFKCGFQSDAGEVSVEFPDSNIRYTRRSAIDASQHYAHGHPLEVFNAPRLPYFEVESHSPVQNLLPGDCIHYVIHERLDPLVSDT